MNDSPESGGEKEWTRHINLCLHSLSLESGTSGCRLDSNVSQSVNTLESQILSGAKGSLRRGQLSLVTNQSIGRLLCKFLETCHHDGRIRVKKNTVGVDAGASSLSTGKILVGSLAQDTGESAKDDVAGGIALGTGIGLRGDTILLPAFVGDTLGVGCRERSKNKLSLHTGMAPSLGGELNDLTDTGHEGVQVFRVCKVLDVVDDLVNDHSGSHVDGLFRVRGGIGGLEGLLAPKCLATDRFAADIHREHLEKGVRLIVPTSQGEQERLEYTVSQRLGHNVFHIGAAKFPSSRSVVEEGWQFRRNFGENILRRVNREVAKVLLGKIVDQLR